jgi:Uncharacterized protein conserved in bacteria (DUF2332)
VRPPPAQASSRAANSRCAASTGRAPAYAAADGDAAAGAAIDTLLRMTDSVVAIAVRRPVRASEPGRCAVLYPAIAETARRVGAN